MEICSFLSSGERQFDFLVAADVLVYFGNLDNLFERVRDFLSVGGHFLFSVEKADSGWSLGDRGRYSHSKDAVRGWARMNGLAVVLERSIRLRKERGEWVQGTGYLLRLPEHP